MTGQPYLSAVQRLDTARFWASIDVRGPGDCWFVKTRIDPAYYPQRGRGLYYHRLAWTLHNQREPDAGMYVMHACDNPHCANPAHLALGTPAQNRAAAVKTGARGRKRRVAPRGCWEGNPHWRVRRDWLLINVRRLDRNAEIAA